MVGAVAGSEEDDFGVEDAEEETADEEEALEEEDEDDPVPAGTPLIVLPVVWMSPLSSQFVPLFVEDCMPVELPDEISETLPKLLFAAMYAAAPIATRHRARAM
jgi:hypothetical protein